MTTITTSSIAQLTPKNKIPSNIFYWLQPHINHINSIRETWKLAIIENEQIHDKNIYIGKSIYETIPIEIKNYIGSFDTPIQKYKLNINSTNATNKQPQSLICNVYIWFPQQQKNYIYNAIIQKIVCWLNLAIQYSPKYCGEKSLTIYLFMSSKKKMASFINEKIHTPHQQLLDRIHINSGQSNGCSSTSEIIVYRKEEWFKVFIHETFHALGLSFKEGYEEHQNELVHSIMAGINPTQQINLFETHCEIMATIFNCIFFILWEEKTLKNGNISCKLTRGGRGGGNTIQKQYKEKRRQTRRYCQQRGGGGGGGGIVFIQKKIMDCIQKEQTFSIYQLNKIINKYCSGNIECFYMSGLEWKENTNVFAYYFAKTIVLCNISNFIEFMETKNKNGGFSLWNWTIKDIEDYVNFVFVVSFDVFKKKYNDILIKNKKVFKRWNKDPIYKTTMRMTTCENKEITPL